MSINDATGVSPSLQVAADLRRKVAWGELRVGDKIPTSREIADEYGVALTTAVRATEELRKEGLIETQRGKGSYVTEAPTPYRWDASRYQRSLTPDPDGPPAEEDPFNRVEANIWTEDASPRIARRLLLDAGSRVSVVEYVWFIDSQPVQISIQWEPLAITEGTPIERPVDGTKGNPGVLARFNSIGLRVDRVDELTRTRMPNAEESKKLAIGPGIPVMEIERTHCAGQTPVETADIVIRGDRIVITATHQLDASKGA
jgi:GntR family transcriptional regulator